MTDVINEIAEKIRSLKAEEKTKLLRCLIAELDGPLRSDVEGEWIDVAKRRYREILEGKATPVPSDRVFENVRARLKQ